MTKIKWLGLQLFGGEGVGGDGGGDGASSGADNAAAAGQETQEEKLLKLGVPADKIRKRSDKSAPKAAEAAAVQQAEVQVDAAGTPKDTTTEEAVTPARMSWDDIMADPEYNKQMQAVVQARLRSAKGAEETLTKLNPALELMARKYGLDPENLDADALTQAVSADHQYYEDKAIEMGVPVETAMKIDQKEREFARKEREEAKTLEQQRIQDHLSKLHQQGEAMKQTFPTFDLAAELKNPAFARMTSPNVGISVEDAYYAIHRNEIQTAAMQVTAQKAAQKIANSIQSGQRRPSEAGTSGTAPSVTTFDYAHATKEQREALKKEIRAAAARGEKLYPGR